MFSSWFNTWPIKCSISRCYRSHDFVAFRLGFFFSPFRATELAINGGKEPRKERQGGTKGPWGSGSLERGWVALSSDVFIAPDRDTFINRRWLIKRWNRNEINEREKRASRAPAPRSRKFWNVEIRSDPPWKNFIFNCYFERVRQIISKILVQKMERRCCCKL